MYIDELQACKPIWLQKFTEGESWQDEAVMGWEEVNQTSVNIKGWMKSKNTC